MDEYPENFRGGQGQIIFYLKKWLQICFILNYVLVLNLIIFGNNGSYCTMNVRHNLRYFFLEFVTTNLKLGRGRGAKSRSEFFWEIDPFWGTGTP